MIKENLSIFFRDTGISAKSGNKVFPVIFDYAADELALGAEGRRIEARCTTADAIALARGDPIQIEGKTYKINQILPVEDGKFSDLILSE
jgi:hypothetical protein